LTGIGAGGKGASVASIRCRQRAGRRSSSASAQHPLRKTPHQTQHPKPHGARLPAGQPGACLGGLRKAFPSRTAKCAANPHVFATPIPTHLGRTFRTPWVGGLRLWVMCCLCRCDPPSNRPMRGPCGELPAVIEIRWLKTTIQSEGVLWRGRFNGRFAGTTVCGKR
jgi:hypothetical protein